MTQAILEPQPGQRLLEVGPGPGCYSVPVADWLTPGGQLDVCDLQQQMLAHTVRRAAAAGHQNLRATHGDARQLPYADIIFDGVYRTAVLEEISDQHAALREFARVSNQAGTGSWVNCSATRTGSAPDRCA